MTVFLGKKGTVHPDSQCQGDPKYEIRKCFNPQQPSYVSRTRPKARSIPNKGQSLPRKSVQFALALVSNARPVKV